jgi:palmitoyltransferase ZDHHC13/17
VGLSAAWQLARCTCWMVFNTCLFPWPLTPPWPLFMQAIKGNGEACTVLLQGGSTSVLSYKDVTGSTPAQLAVEKGHRYLGMHLAEYKQKHEGSGWFGKNSRMAWLTGTQLCPVIWFIGLFLMSTYTYKVGA